MPQANAGFHIPVLPRRILLTLSPQPGESYLDCTAGRGGHAAAIAKLLTSGGTVILNDADAANLAAASAQVSNDAPGIKIKSIHGNFALLPRKVGAGGLRADMLLADLGFSSTQIDDPARGFAFSKPGPLDMRFDVSRGMSASDFVNQAPERELARLIREFGEDSAAGRIARAIVEARAAGAIETTDRLAEVMRSVVGRKPGGIDPATKTFQALRIAVNDEIGSLDALLSQIAAAAERLRQGPGAGASGGSGWLAPGARVAILTFHSLEDRPVKAVFADICRGGFARDLTPGGVTATEEEVQRNPRARSARLRAIALVGGD